MKCSVDVNLTKKAITGWAVSDTNQNLDDCVVSISRNNDLLASCFLGVQRYDVKKAGLHPDGKCGFEFHSKDVNLVEGSIYHVSFKAVDGTSSKCVLYGDKSRFVGEFNRFELPRDDFSIMEGHPDDLFKSGDDLLALKKLLIRLRRGKRAHGWRSSFKGYSYPHIHDDWVSFRKFVEQYVDFLISTLSPRYLWSIVDTYADYADGGEQMAALAVSNMLYQERFAQTYKCVYDFVEKEEKIIDRQLVYWGGMATNRLALDDAYDVFLTRNLECLSEFPLMKRFFIGFVKAMLEVDSSIMHFNVNNSPYFNNMAQFYNQLFK